MSRWVKSETGKTYNPHRHFFGVIEVFRETDQDIVRKEEIVRL